MFLRRLWGFIQEPRTITALTSAYWAMVAGVGVAALVTPPETIAHNVGATLTMVWAAFLLLGGVLGFVGCLPGWWWVERAGMIATATGTLIYLTVVMILHFQGPEPRLVGAGFIALSLFALIVRWFRIRGPQVDPTRGVK